MAGAKVALLVLRVVRGERDSRLLVLAVVVLLLLLLFQRGASLRRRRRGSGDEWRSQGKGDPGMI